MLSRFMIALKVSHETIVGRNMAGCSICLALKRAGIEMTTRPWWTPSRRSSAPSLRKVSQGIRKDAFFQWDLGKPFGHAPVLKTGWGTRDIWDFTDGTSQNGLLQRQLRKDLHLWLRLHYLWMRDRKSGRAPAIPSLANQLAMTSIIRRPILCSHEGTCHVRFLLPAIFDLCPDFGVNSHQTYRNVSSSITLHARFLLSGNFDWCSDFGVNSH